MSVVRRGGFYIRPGVFAAARGFAGRCEHRPLQGLRVTQGLRQFCLPCQREVARPQAVTEGLPYGGLTFEKSGTPERSPGRTMCAPTWGGGSAGLRPAAGFPPVRRGGIYPARGTLRRRKPGRYGIGPYRGGAGCAGFAVGLPPLSKGGGTAEGRDGGIALRRTDASFWRHFAAGQSPDLRSRPPLTRGPIGSVRRDEASRPTVARAVAVVPVGPKRKIYS